MTAAKKEEKDDLILDLDPPLADAPSAVPSEEAAGTKEDKPAKPVEAKKTTKTTKKKSVDFGQVGHDKYPLSAVSGQVSGVIETNHSAVPVLNLSLVGWVGVPPLQLVADGGFDDVRKVLDTLEELARKAL